MGTLHPALHRAREALSSPFFRQHGYTERPLLLQWMPSTDCPLSCGHCLLRGSQPRLAPMAWPLQLALLDEVAELELPELLLSGGEPLALPQFTAIVEAISERGLRWSLNTALRPTREQRELMRQHPPGFVALSLDGDAAFHDAFRGREGAFAEVLEAVRDFRELGAQVAIGTTVHARNFSQLDALFGVVLSSQADSWGLHLCVPEGAGADPSLRLSRRQLSALLDFVALKRRAFPVGLADELGFCGDWEPMLRDAPFFCAAGRAQCVVLPDGSLLPCTSLDLRHSAGRFGEQSLMQLWSAGFAALREHQPSLRCQRCRYAPACGGGCWLQRKHGEECFKDVWMPRQFLGASASLALALGLSACTGMNPPPPPPPEVPAAEQKAEAELGAEPQAQHTALSPERLSEERDTGAVNPDLTLATPSCVATEPFYDAERLEGLLVEWALVRSAWPAEGLPKPSSIIPRLSALDEDPARAD
ncbi:MAG: radical SAM protein, partial [Myxococcota bacterium]|nr:radical SAM protein [Myxococcota bacterium]